MPTPNWIGKEKVVNHHLEVPFYTLEHQYGVSGEDGADNYETHSGNMIIHGDNLLALKALMPEYEGRVNCIYIDPPYNTGKEKWVYNDNVNDPHIRKWLGEVVGKEGEDFSRHDKWLCMMYPRLANPASAAKVKQGEYFERLDKTGRFKYFMTYQHQGVEDAVAVNKLVELMKRM